MTAQRLRLLLAVGCTVLILALAACLPALFVPDHPVLSATPAATLEARAQMFRMYWAEDADCRVERLEQADFSEEELLPSGQEIARMRAELVFDQGDAVVESAGEHFFRLTLPNGSSLRMREYYEQSAGDWSNWFRTYVDVDTLDVYFLYISCKCLQNEVRYDLKTLSGAGVWDLADMWRRYRGYDFFTPLTGEGNALDALYVQGDQALCYHMSYTFYSAPETVVDYMLRVTDLPAAAAAYNEANGLEAAGYSYLLETRQGG